MCPCFNVSSLQMPSLNLELTFMLAMIPNSVLSRIISRNLIMNTPNGPIFHHVG